jgi:kynureninase
MSTVYEPTEAFAHKLDSDDPLRSYRERFHLPYRPDGTPWIYFCGHSLGLQPKDIRTLVDQELDDWASLGVEGHFHGRNPWYDYHEQFCEPGARLVGARPGEVVMMNSLTVNLHLMLATFYRPTHERFKILIDGPPFPSDLYALQTQIRHHGFAADEGLLILRPRQGEHLLRLEDIEDFLACRGTEIAVVLWSGVNYATGQWLNLDRLTAAAQKQGCIVGCDLAHAAGNVPLQLHDWNIDFAVWCSYKYLNAGPGAVAGCFVHEKHGRDLTLPRLAGWWGTDPATRFLMDDGPFVPQPGAAGWQVSNPPILSLAPLRSSLALFDEAGMPSLREKSERLTGFLEYLLKLQPSDRFTIITPASVAERGCQLSLLVPLRAKDTLQALHAKGVLCDFRSPNILRVAPVPLYNTFAEVWEFARIWREVITGSMDTRLEE